VKKLYTTSILATLFAFSSASCQKADGTPTTFPKDELINCVTVDIGKTIPEIGMTLVDYIVKIAASENPFKTFKDLVVTYGINTVACSMRVAANTIDQRRSLVGDNKAAEFIKQQNWQYK